MSLEVPKIKVCNFERKWVGLHSLIMEMDEFSPKGFCLIVLDGETYGFVSDIHMIKEAVFVLEQQILILKRKMESGVLTLHDHEEI